MRELKFRTWDPLAQEIIGWEHWNKLNTFYFINSNGSSVFVMQYTGLKDKNGKEIYEGDIVACKFHPEYHERIDWSHVDIVSSVTWDLCGFGLDAINAEGDRRYPQLSDLSFKESEVIGNIYQHPHLLKEAN